MIAEARNSVRNFHASATLSKMDPEMKYSFILLVMLYDKRS